MNELPPMIEKILQMNPVSHAGDLLLQRLLDKLPVGVYTCDARGLITSYNRQAAAIWGRTPRLNYSLERFCGAHQLFEAGSDAPLPHDESWMAKALREERGFNACEIVIGREDGSRVAVLAYANPLHDPSGKLLGGFNVLMETGIHRSAATALRKTEPVRASHEERLGEQPGPEESDDNGTDLASGVQGAPHLLYVDDDESFVEIMEELLTRRGYRVTPSTSAAEALAAFSKNPAGFDLVLSDINLPGSSGFHVCREIRLINPAQRVALLSGQVTETDRMQARHAGIRHLFNKPMNAAGTVDLIRRILLDEDGKQAASERPCRTGSCGS